MIGRRLLGLLPFTLVFSGPTTAQTNQDIADFTSLLSRVTPQQATAIANARADYNVANPTTPFDTDAAYWYFVFNSANNSWIIHYPVAK